MEIIKEAFNKLKSPKSYLNLILFAISSIFLFALGIATFVAAVVSISVTFSFIFAVFLYKFGSLKFGNMIVDTFPEALLVSILGVILLALLLSLVDSLVSIFNRHIQFNFSNSKKSSRKKK